MVSIRDKESGHGEPRVIKFEKDIFLDKDLAAAQLRRFAENEMFDQIKAKAAALREDRGAANMFCRKLASLKAYYLECEKHPGFLSGQPFLIEKTIIYLRLLSQFAVDGFHELRMTIGKLKRWQRLPRNFGGVIMKT